VKKRDREARGKRGRRESENQKKKIEAHLELAIHLCRVPSQQFKLTRQRTDGRTKSVRDRRNKREIRSFVLAVLVFQQGGEDGVTDVAEEVEVVRMSELNIERNDNEDGEGIVMREDGDEVNRLRVGRDEAGENRLADVDFVDSADATALRRGQQAKKKKNGRKTLARVLAVSERK
jgi:hypothetical protein